MAKFKYGELEDAFLFVSGSGYGMNTAVLNKKTGKILYRSEDADIDEIGDDLDDDGDAWVEMPHKNDLGLGRDLVFRFVADRLPDELDAVDRIFRKRGAYARYKDLLHRHDVLQQWYDFEDAETDRAIRAWCADEGIAFEA